MFGLGLPEGVPVLLADGVGVGGVVAGRGITDAVGCPARVAGVTIAPTEIASAITSTAPRVTAAQSLGPSRETAEAAPARTAPTRDQGPCDLGPCDLGPCDLEPGDLGGWLTRPP